MTSNADVAMSNKRGGHLEMSAAFRQPVVYSLPLGPQLRRLILGQAQARNAGLNGAILVIRKVKIRIRFMGDRRQQR